MNRRSRRWLVLVAAALLAVTMSVAVSYHATAGAATSAPRVTSNPTCDTIGNLTGCVQAYSDALVFSYTGDNLNAQQYVDWIDPDGTPHTKSLACLGPNYSFTANLAPGEYLGGMSMVGTGVPVFPEPSFNYDLVVGAPGSQPSPADIGCQAPPASVGPLNGPVVGLASTPGVNGFWEVTNKGEVVGFGNVGLFGDVSNLPLNMPIVGIAATADGKGYWLDASDGGIFAFGDAGFYGSMGGHALNQPMVGMASTPDGLGYWTVASDGGIFAFGDAGFYGSMGATHLNQPVDGMAADLSTHGYWLVAADGGIFSFNAPFFGSTGNLRLNKPIVEMEASPAGDGYRFVASDGGVFSFNLPFEGSLGANPPQFPVAGMAASGPDGYWLVETSSTVHNFGTAPAL